jgi:hypothetical protein
LLEIFGDEHRAFIHVRDVFLKAVILFEKQQLKSSLFDMKEVKT